MKKRRTIILGIFVLIVVIIAIVNLINKPFNKKVVVVKVEEDGLIVMDAKEDMEYPYAFNIDFSIRGDVGYKVGQELSVDYTDKITDETGLHEIKKIKILKDESDIKIPDSLMAFYYTVQDNVNINISDISNKGIVLEIEDNNDIPFEFENRYDIYNRNNLHEDIIEPNKIIDSTIKLSDENGKTKIKIDWSSVCDELDVGFYSLKIMLKNSRYECLEVKFNILDEGIIEYDIPEFTW